VKRHPLLFSVLAIALAVLLFNASIIQVSAVAPIVIVGAIIATAIGAGTLGWLAHDWLSAKSETPGVDLDTYMHTIADAWETSVRNIVNMANNYAIQVNKAKLLYARYAEYEAKNYVNYTDLNQVEDKVMYSVAYDLWLFKKSVDDGLYNLANELVDFARNRLSGSLENYDIQLGYSSWKTLKEANELRPVFYFESTNVRPVVWIFDSITVGVTDADGDPYIDYGTVTVNLISIAGGENKTITVRQDYGFVTVGVETGIYRIEWSAELNAGKLIVETKTILPISDFSNLKLALAGMVKAADYTGAKRMDAAGLITITGFSNNNIRQIVINDETRSDDIGEVYMILINNIDVTYDTAFSYAKTLHQTLRGMGYTDPGQIPPDMVLPPPDVVMPTVEDLFKNFSQKWEDILAWYLAYLQQVGQTLNESNYQLVKMIDALNYTFADVRQKFMNVILQIGNQTYQLQTLIPLWVSEAQEFLANASNVLKGVMGAIAVFPNGTIKYLEIPVGSIITPGQIITPSGSVPSLTLQNYYSGGLNPVYTPGNWTQPTFVEPASEPVQVALQLFMVILPLLLIVMVMRMVTDLGGRGR